MSLDYPGEERRKETINFKIDIIRKLDENNFELKSMATELKHLSERIEHTNANTKVFKNEILVDVVALKKSIQGDEANGIVGISARLQLLCEQVSNHIVHDNWAYGIFMGLLLLIVGKLFGKY